MVKPAQRGTHPSLRNNLKSWSTPNKWINPRKFARSVYRGSLRIYHRFLPIYSYLVSLVQFIRRIVARISSIWWNVWRDLNKWLKKKNHPFLYNDDILKNRNEKSHRDERKRESFKEESWMVRKWSHDRNYPRKSRVFNRNVWSNFKAKNSPFRSKFV